MGRKVNDLTGYKFGRLLVMGLHPKRSKGGQTNWNCKCDCGNETIVSASNLRNRSTKSCGCFRSDAAKDITGQRFGKLIAIYKTGVIGPRRAKLWLFKCDCGNYIYLEPGQVTGPGNKSKTSCGCIRDYHGEHKSKLYQCWANMKTRCLNPKGRNYRRYGERGINVCKEWFRYPAFREWALDNGYSDNLTIDRIDNDAGYFPENCRWVTVKFNNRNRSTMMLSESKVREIKRLIFNGNKTIEEVKNIYGVSRTIISDIKNGKKWTDVSWA